MSRRERIVSMVLSEKICCLPLFLDEHGFQDLMTEGDIQRVKEPLLHNFVRLPVGDLVFLLILWVTASFV